MRDERALRRFQLRLRAAAAIPPNLVEVADGDDEDELDELDDGGCWCC